MHTSTWLLAAALVLAACEKDLPKGVDTGAPPPSAVPTPPPHPSAPPEEPPHSLTITVSEQGASINGTPLVGAPAEWQAQAVKLFATLPQVNDAQSVAIIATRDAKEPKVAAIVAALRTAKARVVVVHTATRDGSTAEVGLTLHPAAIPDCSAVAMIEHDGGVAVWSKGGGGAQRYTRGMAGPDLSASTDALRKRAAACDSPVWLAAAADAVTWGLTFDLILRAKGGGTSLLKPTETVLLTHPPAAGKPVHED
jgi:hypothetical protein